MQWDPWQWTAYIAVNLVIWACYIAIPVKLRPYDRAILQGRYNKQLFQTFIFACGKHHLLHPAFMLAGWFWPLIVLDSLVAIVSLVAAKSLRFK